MAFNHFKIHASLAAFALIVPMGAMAKATKQTAETMMSTLFDGPPRLAESKLDPAAYVSESVQKLTRARIAYVNWEAIGEILHGMGFSSLPKRLTPELARAILDKAGFAKPLAGEPADAYTDQLRTLYSIRYGGRWINFNFGSGRNGASGMVDIKGIGKTALVRPWADGGHSSGGVGLREAIKEAIWSNILHEELPLGANRVLFVITTGTLTDPNNPASEARAILVREDPMRPAYFQPNAGVRQTLMSDELRIMHTKADDRRMQQLLPRLIEVLPNSREGRRAATPAARLRAGMFAMVDRIALQYATAYTRQIVLAGATTSNVEIDGRALDYGVTTAVIGFPRVHLLDGEAPHGSTETLKNDVVLEFAQDLREVLPEDLKAGVPSDQELAERVDSQFRERVIQGFLELAGSPKEYSQRLAAAGPGRQLGETLLQIAQAGNEQDSQWKHEGMGRSGTYDVEHILNALVAKREAALAQALPDVGLRARLGSEFARYKSELLRLAQTDGIAAQSVERYVKLAVAARNRSMRQMRSGKTLFDEMDRVSEQFKKGAADVVQQYIEKTQARNIREFRASPYQIAANESHLARLDQGLSDRRVFDLKSGTFRRVTKKLSGFANGGRCEAELSR